MSACVHCSGSGESTAYMMLDCPHCTAATERAALEAAIKAAEPMTPYDERWMAYGLGKAEVTRTPKDKYRILDRRDFIEKDDEWLGSDCVTWSLNTSALFFGCQYLPGVFLPARRKIAP